VLVVGESELLVTTEDVSVVGNCSVSAVGAEDDAVDSADDRFVGFAKDCCSCIEV